MYALYFGGMGARGTNFHANVAIRMGYERGGGQDPGAVPGWPQGRRRPPPFRPSCVEQLTLIGPKDKIRHDLEAWRESIVTTLLVGGDPATLRAAAELVLG